MALYPKSREYRQYRVHYFGHFGGPGASKQMLQVQKRFAQAPLQPCRPAASARSLGLGLAQRAQMLLIEDLGLKKHVYSLIPE